ncbi:MAG: BatA domain-containing protein [Akkermansiaceae bacterium]|nr:BatA domain-containing protein [Akkermansiaceae bacterium]
MNLVITNPLGFWALFGIPAVILIHFLQRQARIIPLSTLFLLSQTQRESVSGRRFDRITNSIPLWLQLLMVTLLTWLLVEPRYVKPASTQQVAVILDSSASMTVFKESLKEGLNNKLPDLRGTASNLQLYIFESDPDKPTIYAGDSVEEAVAAVENWAPAAGAIDPTSALRLARSRVNREGILVYITDSPVESLPFDAQVLAIGETLPNCGFTGVSFDTSDEKLVWKAVIRNYSDKELTRTWQVEFADGSLSKPTQLTISSGGMSTIASSFPNGTDRLRVLLNEDSFPLDDQLPLVRPAPKDLNIWSNTAPKFANFNARLSNSFPNVAFVNDSSEADISLVSYDPLSPELPSADSIVVVDETTQSRRYLRGGIVAEKHPLMDGLNWQSLLVRESIELGLTEADEVLLWQGNRPLIALRDTTVFDEEKGPDGAIISSAARRISQLILNFDPTLSNAFKLPATVVLLHRFCENLRDQKIAPESRNTETGQAISVSAHQGPEADPLVFTSFGPDGKESDQKVINIDRAKDLRAPATPGFFTIRQGEQLLLRSAAHFADTREADLRSCTSQDNVSAITGEAVDLHTRQDHLWRIWVFLVLIALVLAWYFTKERPKDEDQATPTPVR